MDDVWEELEGLGSMESYRVSMHTEPSDPLMACIFATLAVAFAACCVWLAIRVYNRRERWAKWTAVTVGLIAVLVGYPLSMGPAAWLIINIPLPDWAWDAAKWLYQPVVWTLSQSPRKVRDPFDWYLMLFGVHL